MYQYKYTYKSSADKEDFNRIYTLISEKFPSLTSKKSREEKNETAVFRDLSADSDKEVISLIIDEGEKTLEVYSEMHLDFLRGFRSEKLPSIESLASKDSCDSNRNKKIIIFEFGFLLMNIIMGALNSDSFSLGFMSGGLDGPFDEPLNNILRSLPFAAVYFFSYRALKKDTGYSGIHIRFIQLGGIVTAAAIPLSILTCFFPGGLGLFILLMLMCAINIALYAMITAIILELIIGRITGK